MKPESLRRWTIHISHLAVVPVSRNWYKTVSKIKQKRIYHIFYKSYSIKLIVALNWSYSTNTHQSKKDNIRHEPENLKFAYNLIFCLNLAFLIDIIDTIITFSPYSLNDVKRTSADDNAVYWSRYRRKSRDQYTALLLEKNIVM